MNNQPPPDNESALADKEALRREIDRLLGDLATRLLGDQQAQQTVLAIAGTVMTAWSAGNPFKKIIAALALKTWPNLPATGAEDRSAGLAADLARLIVLRWRLRTREIRNNPHAMAENQAVFVRAFLDHIDLSAWKTLMETAKDGRIEAVQKVNEILSQYQGKHLVLLSTLPTIISLMANVAKSHVDTQLKVMPPEMLFEIFDGLNTRIDWEEVGRTLNGWFDLARRIHVGSDLGGDGVTPALRILTADVLKRIVSQIDPGRYAEAAAAKAGNREAIKNAVSDMMRTHPDFGKQMFMAAALSGNARVRGLKNRLQILADLPGQDLGTVVHGLTESLDEQELADLISLIAQITNAVYAANPDCLPASVAGLVAAVDFDQIRDLAESRLIPELFQAIRPLALILMPPIIHGLCDLLTPGPEGVDPELQAALDRLAGIRGGLNADR